MNSSFTAGGEVSTKGELREEWKYAVYLHDILKVSTRDTQV